VLISVDRTFQTDLVRNRKVTSYAAVRDDLQNSGGQYLDVPAVRDGRVITGRVPDDLPEFCQEIIAYFQTQAVNTTETG